MQIIWYVFSQNRDVKTFTKQHFSWQLLFTVSEYLTATFSVTSKHNYMIYKCNKNERHS